MAQNITELKNECYLGKGKEGVGKVLEDNSPVLKGKKNYTMSERVNQVE